MRTLLTSLALSLSLAATAFAQQSVALERTQGPRLRMGGDLGFGIGDAGSIGLSASIDTHLRAGVQIDDSFALYYQGGAVMGGGAAPVVFSDGPRETFYHTSSVLAELTLANVFQLAVGPTFGFGTFAGGVFLGGGAAARIGVAFGGDGLGTRQGFSLALQGEGVFTDGARNMQVQLLLGWETF